MIIIMIMIMIIIIIVMIIAIVKRAGSCTHKVEEADGLSR